MACIFQNFSIKNGLVSTLTMSEFFLIAPIELWNYENIVVQLHVENSFS